ALQEGWELLVLDPAGAAVLVPRPAVVALATGRPWVPALVAGEVRVEVVRVLRDVLDGLPYLLDVRARAGDRAEVAVELVLQDGLGRAALDGLLTAVGSRLASAEPVVMAVDSLELRVVGRSR
ncbi:hypothetical protein N869_03230, partial [Cellulomonas bogoriensis 69B4 = DSM 16987]